MVRGRGPVCAEAATEGRCVPHIRARAGSEGVCSASEHGEGGCVLHPVSARANYSPPLLAPAHRPAQITATPLLPWPSHAGRLTPRPTRAPSPRLRSAPPQPPRMAGWLCATRPAAATPPRGTGCPTLATARSTASSERNGSLSESKP